MLARAKIAGVLAGALLLTAVPSFAQTRWQQRQAQRQAERQARRAEQQQQKEARAAHPPQGHAGDWLRKYKNLPPAQQRQALQNDPQFQRLPPQRQAQLLQRLQHFSSLPPQQQERILNRMEIWEHLTAEQKHEARALHQQIQQLPPRRRVMLNMAIGRMRDMTPEQRQRFIDSKRFKNMFSDHERDLLSGAARLPLAPGDGGQPEAPQE